MNFALIYSNGKWHSASSICLISFSKDNVIGFCVEQGTSFQVILSGLSPVTMDMDWSCGGSVMKASPADHWDEAALTFIR